MSRVELSAWAGNPFASPAPDLTHVLVEFNRGWVTLTREDGTELTFLRRGAQS